MPTVKVGIKDVNLGSKLGAAASAAIELQNRLADTLASLQTQAVELAQLNKRSAHAAAERAKVEGERDAARKEASAAREDAAKLRG